MLPPVYEGKYHAIWFPMESMWMVFDSDHNPKSDFINTIDEAKEYMKKLNKEG